MITFQQYFVIPAKERVKKSDGATTLRHSRESGNPERPSERLSGVFLAEPPDWIPAFAGMTKYCRRVIVFFHADSSASLSLFVRGVRFLHTLESGNPEAARARLSDVFLAETEDWIPAFAGMTKFCRRGIVFIYGKSSAIPPLFVKGVRFLHTLFRGNDEVLSAGCWLSLRRHFGVPAVICERRPISSHARQRESPVQPPSAAMP